MTFYEAVLQTLKKDKMFLVCLLLGLILGTLTNSAIMATGFFSIVWFIVYRFITIGSLMIMLFALLFYYRR